MTTTYDLVSAGKVINWQLETLHALVPRVEAFERQNNGTLGSHMASNT